MKGRPWHKSEAEYDVHPTQLQRWCAIVLEGLPSLFKKEGKTTELKAAYEQLFVELYAELLPIY
jgi:hypothetical protein